MTANRFDRQERLFGKEGQAKIAACRVAVVGIGGLGTHVVQQLAHLGVSHLTLIDAENLDETNRNRYVGSREDDPIPGSRKVDLGERTAKAITSAVSIQKVYNSFVSAEGFAALREVEVVFGCLDEDGFRLVLNEFCAAYDRAYLDLATDIIPDSPIAYGGRVCTIWQRPGCTVCYDLLDLGRAEEDLAAPGERGAREAVYGIDAGELDRSGPSVVSINGVVASLAVTEFVCALTGLRSPRPVLTYRAQSGVVSAVTERPAPDCYYCGDVRSQTDSAGLERYLT